MAGVTKEEIDYAVSMINCCKETRDSGVSHLMRHFNGYIEAANFVHTKLKSTLDDRARDDRIGLRSFIYRKYEPCVEKGGEVHKMNWTVDKIPMCRASFAACYGVSKYLLDEIATLMKTTKHGNPNLATIGRQFTDATRPDIGFYGALHCLDKNLVETPGPVDGKEQMFLELMFFVFQLVCFA